MENEEFLEKARQAIETHDAALLEFLVDSVSTYCFEEDRFDQTPFDPELFAFLLNQIQSPKLHTMESSFYLIMLFEHDWARFTKEQKAELLPILERNYKLYVDFMAWYVIAEILARFYANEAAFSTLKRLREVTSGTPPQELIPLGFGLLARYAKDPDLRIRSKNELMGLANSKDCEMAKAAQECLEDLRI